MEEELDLFELFEILIKRWRFLFGLVAIAAITSAVVSVYVLDPVYEAEATVLFRPETEESRPMVLTDTAVAPYASLSLLDPTTVISLNNKVEIFESRAVLDRAKEKVGLTDNRVYENVVVEPMTKSTGLQIKVQFPSAKIAAGFANAVLEEGLTFIEKQKAEELARAYQFISTQLEIVDQRLGSLEEELAKNHGSFNNELQWKIATNDQLYRVLSQKLLEMEVMQANPVEDIEFIQRAIEPKEPVKPNELLNVALATFLGLFVGVFIVFVQHAYAERKASISL